MVRKVSFCLAIVVLLTVMGLGCAAPKPAPAPVPTEPIILTFASPMPDFEPQYWGTPEVGTMHPWAVAIEERTEGRYKIEGHHFGTVLGTFQQLEGIEAGVADIGLIGLTFFPAAFPSRWISGVFDPVVGLTPELGTMVSWILYDEFPVFYEELEAHNLYPLMHASTGANAFIERIPTPTLADLKGTRQRVWAGQFQAQLFEAFGATPMNISFDEVYEGLDKGVYDGMITNTTLMVSSKLHEVAKYYYSVGRGIYPPLVGAFMPVVHKPVWDSLPSDIKLIFLEEAKRVERKYTTDISDKLVPEALTTMENAGVLISDFSPSDLESWHNLAAPIWDSVAEAMNEEGLPGTEITQRYLELVEKTTPEEIFRLYNLAWEKRFAEATK